MPDRLCQAEGSLGCAGKGGEDTIRDCDAICPNCDDSDPLNVNGCVDCCTDPPGEICQGWDGSEINCQTENPYVLDSHDGSGDYWCNNIGGGAENCKNDWVAEGKVVRFKSTNLGGSGCCCNQHDYWQIDGSQICQAGIISGDITDCGSGLPLDAPWMGGCSCGSNHLNCRGGCSHETAEQCCDSLGLGSVATYLGSGGTGYSGMYYCGTTAPNFNPEPGNRAFAAANGSSMAEGGLTRKSPMSNRRPNNLNLDQIMKTAPHVLIDAKTYKLNEIECDRWEPVEHPKYNKKGTGCRFIDGGLGKLYDATSEDMIFEDTLEMICNANGVADCSGGGGGGGLNCHNHCTPWITENCGGWTCLDQQYYKHRSCTHPQCPEQACVGSTDCMNNDDDAWYNGPEQNNSLGKETGDRPFGACCVGRGRCHNYDWCTSANTLPSDGMNLCTSGESDYNGVCYEYDGTHTTGDAGRTQIPCTSYGHFLCTNGGRKGNPIWNEMGRCTGCESNQGANTQNACVSNCVTDQSAVYLGLALDCGDCGTSLGFGGTPWLSGDMSNFDSWDWIGSGEWATLIGPSAPTISGQNPNVIQGVGVYHERYNCDAGCPHNWDYNCMCYDPDEVYLALEQVVGSEYTNYYCEQVAGSLYNLTHPNGDPYMDGCEDDMDCGNWFTCMCTII